MPGRSPSLIGSVSVGDIDWTNLQDNWREQDAEWLQERGVARVATTPSAETNLINKNAGRVFYSESNKVLYVSIGTGYKTVVASDALVATDTNTTVTLSVSGQSGFVFTKTGGVSISALTATSLTSTTATITNIIGTAGSGTFKTTSAGVEVDTTGSNKVTLTTGSAGLLVDSPVSVTGGITTSASSTFSGGLSASGTAALTNATVSGTLSVGGNLTGAAGSFSTGTFSGTITAPTINAASGADLTLAIRSGRAIRVTSPTVADANIYYGASGTSIRNAWVVYGSDPGVANVPEGTIWIT